MESEKSFLLVMLVIKIPCEKLLQFDGKMVKESVEETRKGKTREMYENKSFGTQMRGK